jgi:hypothetical protein
MSKISYKAVIIGSITDIITTNITAAPLFFYILHTMSKAGMSQAEIQSTVLLTYRTDPIYFTLGMFLGGLCSILGGYVSARIAKEHELLNGALASFLCVGGGVYSLFVGSSGQPLWYHLLAIFLSIVLATLGGYICRARKYKTLGAVA